MFNKKITPFACIVLCLAVCAVTFVGVYSYSSVKFKAEQDEYRKATSAYYDYAEFISTVGAGEQDKYTKLAKIIDMIEADYIRDYDKELLWDNIYRSLAVSIGDEYSQYLTAEEYASLVDSSDGEFVGIGVHATYDVDTEGVYIFGVIPDSPAEKGGMENGDIIVAVEGVETTESNYYTVLDTIRGAAGTEVSLTVLRNGERIDLTLVRADVASENILYEKLEGNIAYMRILSFADESVSEEFTKKTALAQSEGCDKFIFDVRNNTGGYLGEICSVLDLLLPEGPIINIVDSSGNTTTQNSDGNCIKGEMVVLCNDVTASAAELFTAALRDYDLAEIVGETTFGKGTMQTTTLLSDKSAFKISTAFYNPPNNESYDGVGITPDYEIELGEEWENRFYKMPKEKDAQFQKALELLGSTN